MNKSDRIYVAGHRGLVGSAICRALQRKGYANLITRPHSELDLLDQTSVARFFNEEKPDIVFLAAARVGGILANNVFRADFIYQNLQIQNNVIHQSFKSQVKKLLFLGSSCIYPRNCPQPIQEESLLTNPLEYTNEPYAIAKIAGLKMCEAYNLQYGTNFIAAMPTNMYGPGDNFDLEKSHVLPALVRKFHLAKLAAQKDIHGIQRDEAVFGHIPKEIKTSLGIESDRQGFISVTGTPEVLVWGTGRPKREFMFSDDLADACVLLMEKVNFRDIIKCYHDKGREEFRNCHINIGTGKEISIAKLVELIKEITGFKGRVRFDSSKPGGTPLKCLDVKRLKDFDFKERINLKEGVSRVYAWYIQQLRS